MPRNTEKTDAGIQASFDNFPTSRSLTKSKHKKENSNLREALLMSRECLIINITLLHYTRLFEKSLSTN